MNHKDVYDLQYFALNHMRAKINKSMEEMRISRDLIFQLDPSRDEPIEANQIQGHVKRITNTLHDAEISLLEVKNKIHILVVKNTL